MTCQHKRTEYPTEEGRVHCLDCGMEWSAANGAVLYDPEEDDD